MSRRDVRSRDPAKSVWTDLPEDVFRQHLVKLEERTNAVPIAPKIFHPSDWLPMSSATANSSHTLPFQLEQQVADDFACLAAVEEGAQSVAAVCLEESSHAPRLTLRFAALDTSLNDHVRLTLQEVSAVLANASSAEEADCSQFIETLFRCVIRLHFRRLIARCRSSKWEKPKYLSKSHKKPLYQDFQNLIHRAQFLYTRKEKAVRQLVEKTCSELAATYEAFEVSPDDLTGMESLVRASHTFWSNDVIHDFLQRLEGSTGSTPTAQVGAAIKTLRQTQKIASYRRISVSLISTAKKYPQLFEGGLVLAYVTPYSSVPTSIAFEEWAKTCHVHAEVQLAVHYDLVAQHKDCLAPRAIGISKSLCYLCYQFLRHHKGFFPSRTHGRLYDQWTVPDLAEFDADMATRYGSILQDVDREVLDQTENEPELWRVEPMTSIDVYCGSSQG
jgi:hypothetical protein